MIERQTALQQTIGGVATVEGLGLFHSERTRLTFRPGEVDTGVVFRWLDPAGNATELAAHVEDVVPEDRRTVIAVPDHPEGLKIETSEHCLSAIAGLAIDNIVIEIDGLEMPGGDGSANCFVEALQSAGIVTQSAPRRVLRVTEPVEMHQGEAWIKIEPSDQPGLTVHYDLDYTGVPAIGRQVYQYEGGPAAYLEQIAMCRTFVLEPEARILRQHGMGKHLDESTLLVVGDDGPLAPNAFRGDDEPVRHKILDLIGDLSLVGCAIQGRVTAYKSGHRLNQDLARRLVELEKISP